MTGYSRRKSRRVTGFIALLVLFLLLFMFLTSSSSSSSSDHHHHHHHHHHHGTIEHSSHGSLERSKPSFRLRHHDSNGGSSGSGYSRGSDNVFEDGKRRIFTGPNPLHNR
ncbi:PREDICTED: CLAVATA3/ESR (CLE)-related protein 22 [Tarenaya hassleriana]|uniref:CLAVATA3/ESR (CLE)-related protein 22 n=1 Tax=Tarenaya hassleriana TaxID=28532 RepID=UPI0008FD7946|nr:PREDICTED: CLAVATA3/ESR (CLE)-related protein 22 [Tarenaya hassleriana]